MTPTDQREDIQKTSGHLPDISVIIPTYRGGHWLYEALESLRCQTLPPDRFEIIVVDDTPAGKVTDMLKENVWSGYRLRCCRNDRRGVSRARNRGIACATGAYIAFLDDDAVASPEWLTCIVRTFESVHPRPICVGGRVMLRWEADRPRWLPDALLPYLGLVEFGDHPHMLASHDLLVASNMAFDRRMSQHHPFDAALGLVAGTGYLSEEMPMQMSVNGKQGMRYYHPGIQVYHRISSARLTRSWFLGRIYRQGISDMRMRRIYGYMPPLIRRDISSVAGVTGLMLFLYPTSQNLFLALTLFAKIAGRLCGLQYVIVPASGRRNES